MPIASILTAFLLARQDLPPLSFAGFRAHMPMSEARAHTVDGGGTLGCKATTDPRLRECNGLALTKPGGRFNLLISSVRDTAAVIVLSGDIPENEIRELARELTRDFGTPDHKGEKGTSERWQWVRRSQMLRLILHKAAGKVEAAITLTDGPLLDALGPPPPRPPSPLPKKQTPD